jgi:hypothetical protein
MPKRSAVVTEQVILSPEDADAADLFLFRRSFNEDSTLRYVQVLGDEEEIDAFARNEPVVVKPGAKSKQKAYSLPRLIAQRMLGRPLMPEELIKPKNGKYGDCRRSNLELTNRSELASGEREGTWSNTGAKYIYPTEGGRFFVNYSDIYLGTYDTTTQAEEALELFKRLTADGMSDEEAARRVKSRSRNAGRISIQPD